MGNLCYRDNEAVYVEQRSLSESVVKREFERFPKARSFFLGAAENVAAENVVAVNVVADQSDEERAAMVERLNRGYEITRKANEAHEKATAIHPPLPTTSTSSNMAMSSNPSGI